MPLVSNATLCSNPASIAIAVSTPDAVDVGNTRGLVLVLSPTWPLVFRPQALTRPSAISARLCWPPQATAMTGPFRLSVFTVVGSGLSVVEPLPS